MDKTSFTDIEGNVWNIRIVFSDIERVRKHVVNKNGKAIDLLDVTEKGDISTISEDSHIFPTIIFWLLFDQVMAKFPEKEYDQKHRFDQELISVNPLQKAANWFGDLLGGKEIAEMGEAFEGALLNFISPKVQSRIRNIMTKQKELQCAILDKAESQVIDMISAGRAELLENAPPSSELLPMVSPTAN